MFGNPARELWMRKIVLNLIEQILQRCVRDKVLPICEEFCESGIVLGEQKATACEHIKDAHGYDVALVYAPDVDVNACAAVNLVELGLVARRPHVSCTVRFS